MLVKNIFMRIHLIIVMSVMILYIIIKLFEIYYFYYLKLTKYDYISNVIFYEHHLSFAKCLI